MNPIIHFTELELNSAYEKAQEASLSLKTDIYNNNSKLQNSLVGFLGELAFKKLLDNYNYYYRTDEEDLVKTSKINSDLGDIYGSKTEHSIDIKTTINKYGKELHLLVNADKLLTNSNIDSYIHVEIYLHDNKESITFNNIKYAQIMGSIHRETFLKIGHKIELSNRINYSLPTSKLSKIDKLIKREFYTNEEFIEYKNYLKNTKTSIKYIKREDFISFLLNTNEEYRILHFYKMSGEPIFPPLVKSIDIKRFNAIINHNNSQNFNNYSKFRELRGFKSDYTNVYYNHSWISKDNFILIQTLVRNIRKAAKQAEINNQRLYVPINETLHNLVINYIKDEYPITFIY